MFLFDSAWRCEARAQLGLALAVSVTMAAQLTMSAVETAIVARLGVAVLAGVTLALALYLPLFLLSLGVVTAITPLAAAARGAGDTEGLCRVFQQGVWAGLSFSVPSALALLLAGHLVTGVLGPGAEAASAAAYLAGAAWGLPVWVTYVAIRSLAIATARVRATGVIMLASVPLNAAMSWLLVFGAPGLAMPGLGALGAGLAYSLTAIVALLLLAAILAVARWGEFGEAFRRKPVWDGPRYRALLRLGVPFALRILLREGVLPAASLVLAPFGVEALAAHAVATRVTELAGVFAYGFSAAGTARVGHALGAGAVPRARRAGETAVLLAGATGGAMAVALLLDPPLVIGWVLGHASAAAVALLPFAACLQALETLQGGAGGALAGMRDARGPLLIALVGLWGVGMPAGVLLAHAEASASCGMWQGLVAGAAVTAVLLLLRFRAGMARLAAR